MLNHLSRSFVVVAAFLALVGPVNAQQDSTYLTQSAVRLLPAQQAQTAPTSTSSTDPTPPLSNSTNSGIPVGYEEAVFPVGAGEISYAAYNAAATAGFAVNTCRPDTSNELSGVSNFDGRCTDGRFTYKVLGQNPGGGSGVVCDAQYTSSVYLVLSSNGTPSYRSCATPGSTVKTLRKVETGATPTELTPAQINNPEWVGSTNGVSVDVPSMTRVCNSNGYARSYAYASATFASCGNNFLVTHRTGSWVRIAARDSGESCSRVERLVCTN